MSSAIATAAVVDSVASRTAALQLPAGDADGAVMLDSVRDILDALAAEGDGGLALTIVILIVSSRLLFPALVFLHEAGHALAALAVGHRATELRVGDEQPLVSVRFHGFSLKLGRITDHADVLGYVRHRGTQSPGRILMISLAGPLASLAGAVATGIALVTLPLATTSIMLALGSLMSLLLCLMALIPDGDDPNTWTDGRWAQLAWRELRRDAA